MSALDGRHVLVAGVREPEGRALAVALAEAGAAVSVTTRRAEFSEEVTANSILNECWTFGHEGRALTLDLDDEADVAAALAGLEAELAPIDAAIAPLPQPGEDPAAEVIATVAAQRMAERGAGVVVLPMPAGGGEALLALMGSLGGAWGPQGVLVVRVAAGGDFVAAVGEALDAG